MTRTAQNMNTTIPTNSRLIVFLTFLLWFFTYNTAFAQAFFTNSTQSSQIKAGEQLLRHNNQAADNLAAQLNTKLTPDKRIVAVSFVNLDDFENTTPLGRLISSQVADKLTTAGYGIREYRISDTITITPEQGEFILTRNEKQLLQDSFQAEALLLGSYSVEKYNVFISARIVRLDTGITIAANSYSLPNTGPVSKLLNIKKELNIFSNYLRKRPILNNTNSPAAENNQQKNNSALPTPSQIFKIFPPQRIQ